VLRIEAGTVPVEDLVDEVQRAVKEANVGSGGPGDLRVTSVQLVLNVVAATSGGGQLDFRIPVIGMRLRVGAKVSRADTHTIDVTLVPPADDEHEVRGGDVARVLVEAIATIRAVMRRAATGEERFDLETASVQLSFVLTDEGTISFGVDGELRDEVTHTITLTLGPPAG
jgi:hypothetical protein